MDKIDFVITWVDGSDPKWIEEKNKYDPDIKTDSRTIRYRDYNNLRYWFRGVEEFAPWVNKIHFVTWGHVPDWLRLDHPKLNIVKHEDYIPNEYLPTFSARPIELNLHRIQGLSDKFVYFNDDMFIIRPIEKKVFFEKGLPNDTAALDISIKDDEAHGSAVINSIFLINKHFDKKTVMRSDFKKWYNPLYGKELIRTILLTPWNFFPGFYTPHLPNAYSKSTFHEVWNLEFEALDISCSNKFRSKLDVTQYIFKFWQLASGKFNPKKVSGRAFSLGHDYEFARKAIENKKYDFICINDSEDISNFTEISDGIRSSFNVILPKKSSYEM